LLNTLAENIGKTASPQFIASLADVVYKQIGKARLWFNSSRPRLDNVTQLSLFLFSETLALDVDMFAR
jgi:hypothetical protein